jgi:hypothetical protein
MHFSCQAKCIVHQNYWYFGPPVPRGGGDGDGDGDGDGKHGEDHSDDATRYSAVDCPVETDDESKDHHDIHSHLFRYRPLFLGHVTNEMLHEAWTLAQQRHEYSIKQAQRHYPIFDVSTTTTAASNKERTQEHRNDMNDAITPFNRYEIYAPGSLPDAMNDEIPREVYVSTVPIFSSQECNQVIHDAETYFAAMTNVSEAAAGAGAGAGAVDHTLIWTIQCSWVLDQAYTCCQ